MDPRVDAIARLVRGRVDFTNIVATCIEVAQEVEQLKDIKGKEKLDILQKVLRTHVYESKISMEEKEDSLRFIDTVVPLVVQAAIFASKSPIAKHVQATCWACWTKK